MSETTSEKIVLIYCGRTRSGKHGYREVKPGEEVTAENVFDDWHIWARPLGQRHTPGYVFECDGQRGDDGEVSTVTTRTDRYFHGASVSNEAKAALRTSHQIHEAERRAKAADWFKTGLEGFRELYKRSPPAERAILISQVVLYISTGRKS